jgi:hypothetical protein
LVGQFNRLDYTNAVIPAVLGSAESKTGLVGAVLIWHHGRALEVRLRYEHSAYSVASGDSGYQENRVFVTVGYRPFSRFADTELSEPPITN